MSVRTGLLITTNGGVARVSIEGLSDMQRCVGGYIEVLNVTIAGHPCSIFLNEEGKLIDLPINSLMMQLIIDSDKLSLFPGDYLAGDILVLGGVDGGGNTLSLDPEAMEVLMAAIPRI